MCVLRVCYAREEYDCWKKIAIYSHVSNQSNKMISESKYWILLNSGDSIRKYSSLINSIPTQLTLRLIYISH